MSKIMVKMSKNHFSLCGFTTVIFIFVHHVNAHDQSAGKGQFLCSESASFYRCNDGKEHKISQKTYTATGESSSAVIEAWGENTVIEADTIIINGISYVNGHAGKNSWTTGIKASHQGGVALFNSILKGVSIGAEVDEEGAFEMRDGVLEATRMGVSVVGDASFAFLNNIEITMGIDAISLFSQAGANIYMQGGKIDFTHGIGVQTGGEGKVTLERVVMRGRQKQITGDYSKNAAFSMLQGQGSIEFQKGSVDVSDAHGILLQGNDHNAAYLKNSMVVVRSEAFHGMHFFWEAVFEGQKTILPGKAAVHLEKTGFFVLKSAAIYSQKFESSVQLSKGSKLSGDLLLKAEENSTVKVTADASTLIGGASVDESSTADLQLKNGSKWSLSRPKYEKLQNMHSSGSQLGNYSFLSSLNLTDSSVIFEKLKSKTGDDYQTLLVGKGTGAVYHAQGNAYLYLSTYLDKGGKLQEQKTDRFLIHGDVLGTTTVHVQSVSGSPGEYTGEHGNDKGISIIQVYGKAEENSFQLNGGYVTLQGSPYQYSLYAYGPNSSLGKADARQRVIKGEEDFWDFRLESEFVLSPSSDYTDLLLVPDIDMSHLTPSNNHPSSLPNQFPNLSENENNFESDLEGLNFSSDFSDTAVFSVMISGGAAVPESEVQSYSPVSRSSSAASNPTVKEPITSVITESASDAVVSVPVAASSKDTSPRSDLDRVSLISKLSSEFSPHVRQNVRAVVPQVPTYLLLPNSLFHTGWMDISSQNKQLAKLRNISRRWLKIDESPIWFLHGYSGSYRYASNLSVFEYGYGGELDYQAIEAGSVLKNIESTYSTTSFGVMGRYGKFSLQPLVVKQSQESTFDKWSVTAYGSMQHDTGFYMDGLFSYGLFSGNVLTLARGKTAILRGKPLSFSLTTGKAFMVGCKNFVLDPQIQFSYQHLRFRKTYDIDGFDIEMRNPDYWMMRVGGRLSKALAALEEAHVISFYGQIYFIRDFSNKHFVSFGDSFLLGAVGSSFEAGLGVYAQLSTKITFHSDLTYQHKFTKAGFSGTHFSGGLSYHF